MKCRKHLIQCRAESGESLEALALRVRRIAEGDERAAQELHGALTPVLLGFFRRVTGGNTAAAEELALQALSEAFQAIAAGRYDPQQASFPAFVYGVAYRIRLRFLRSRRNIREMPFSTLQHGAPESATEDASHELAVDLSLDEIGGMWECLYNSDGPCALSPEERFVVIGRAHHKTFQVLANELGRSLDTVHRLNLRSIEKLRKCMNAKGFS